MASGGVYLNTQLHRSLEFVASWATHGSVDQARSLYAKALSLEPGNNVAKTALAQLRSHDAT